MRGKSKRTLQNTVVCFCYTHVVTVDPTPLKRLSLRINLGTNRQKVSLDTCTSAKLV